jgi:3',5'-cyclic AMP phosphodiesterase CpdA
MLARILHISDLHVGAHGSDRLAFEEPLRLLAEQLAPELVVATGDLSHHNGPAEHARAAALLHSLGPPVLAVPGNHDLPSLPPRRVVSPFAEFLRQWPDAEPVYRSDSVVVCGLNSVRPWAYQRGALSTSQLQHAADVLATARDGALPVVALHHHLAGAPWRTGKRSIRRRSHVLGALAAARAELVVSGHTHQGLVVEHREFLDGPERSGCLVVATAAGIGHPRPGRHAEAVGLQFYEADGDTLSATSFAGVSGRFVVVARRHYSRNRT